MAIWFDEMESQWRKGSSQKRNQEACGLTMKTAGSIDTDTAKWLKNLVINYDEQRDAVWRYGYTGPGR